MVPLPPWSRVQAYWYVRPVPTVVDFRDTALPASGVVVLAVSPPPFQAIAPSATTYVA